MLKPIKAHKTFTTKSHDTHTHTQMHAFHFHHSVKTSGISGLFCSYFWINFSIHEISSLLHDALTPPLLLDNV
jgi:hypothetical protein